VAQPVDPQQALTLTQAGRGILAVWPTLLVLTAVAAGIGTILAGPRLPEAGAFAAGVGLAGLALRGYSMQTVLAYAGSNELGGRRSLMASMAGETLLWAAILAVAWVVADGVRRWLWPDQSAEGGDQESDPPGRGPAAAPQNRKPAAAAATGSGWPAFAVTTVAAALVIWLTIARTPVAEIARGQVYASVAGGLLLGALVARYFTDVPDARWYVLAVPAVALIGYLLGYLNAGMGWTQGSGYQPFAELATTPPHVLVRPLPIEYAAVGLAGALAGFWSGQKIHHAAEGSS